MVGRAEGQVGGWIQGATVAVVAAVAETEGVRESRAGTVVGVAAPVAAAAAARGLAVEEECMAPQGLCRWQTLRGGPEGEWESHRTYSCIQFMTEGHMGVRI